MSLSFSKLFRKLAPVIALGALVLAMGGTWATAQPATTAAPRTAAAKPGEPVVASASGARAAAKSGDAGAKSGDTGAKSGDAGAKSGDAGEPGEADEPGAKPGKKRGARKEVTGKLNLNTATEEQLVLLPTVGPSKAERVITWRKKNGGFKRVADLRRVKGFGYKTFKRLEPFLDITGETTLAVKR